MTKEGREPRDVALEHLYAHESLAQDSALPAGRAGKIIAGVLAGLEGFDEAIEDVSERWSVARMPLVDRNILRIAVYELHNEPDTPAAVIVSEAVRLAQTYSTERSASFVNGVLATLAKTIRGE